MKRVEILAPAGNMDSFYAAINAGADAVYLAGKSFGARAYAGNFEKEELIYALSYAHLLGVKVYLTVNTLLKEGEIGLLYDYLLPYYENGLDGVIVQDFGVLKVIRTYFPELPVHISTQMTITSCLGAEFAIENGAVRIVPARELSLDEISRIHEKFPELELECFIHGALCYSYSGQCLFSSMIGGRSGNRGTCAQPCRLPYKICEKGANNGYPLSLKDLMTAGMLPSLIKAGISSFKIEGRMKAPEYVAGVTGIYKDNVNRYYDDPKSYNGPTAEEKKILSELYVRSSLCDGYYNRHNGKCMVTGDKPCYKGVSDEVLNKVSSKYMSIKRKKDVCIKSFFEEGNKSRLIAFCGDISAEAVGDVVQTAKNSPVTKENIEKQLLKTGDAPFNITRTDIVTSGNIFMPVSQINALRRNCFNELIDKFTTKRSAETAYEEKTGDKLPAYNAHSYSAYVITDQSLQAVLKSAFFFDRIYAGDSLMDRLFEGVIPKEKAFYALPRIIRKNNADKCRKNIEKLLDNELISGLYVESVDALKLAKKYDTRLILSPFMYAMNAVACDILSEYSECLSIPYELNEGEIYNLVRKKGPVKFEMTVYGRTPFMVSAGCINKTAFNDSCLHSRGFMYIEDQKKKKLPVYRYCDNCYNVIFNSVPTCLLKNLGKISKIPGVESFLLYFSDENAEDCERVIRAFEEGDVSLLQGKEFTGGHFGRGVI